MTNWPGPTASGSVVAGSSASVHVSRVSRSRRATTNGTGANAPHGASAAAAIAIDIEQSKTRPLQPLHQHLRKAAHQVVAEGRVVVALLPQARAVEAGRSDDAQRARVEVPAVGGEEPRPADHIVRVDR